MMPSRTLVGQSAVRGAHFSRCIGWEFHMQGGPASVLKVALFENHPWMPTDGAP
jgi:hypothetical protein